jgi:hypothetical protein
MKMSKELKKFSNIVILDLGKNKVTMYHPLTGEHKVINPDELFERSYQFPKNTLVVGEIAHFGTPRQDDFEGGKLSKAQYYFAKQLLEWYNELAIRGITLKLFPQKLTERSRRLNESRLNTMIDEVVNLENKKTNKKSDLIDTMAIWIHLNDFPRTTLKNPPKTFADNPERLEGLKMRNDMTDDKNPMRFFDYTHEKDKVSQWVKDNINELKSLLPKEVRKTFGLSGENLITKKGNLHADVKLSQITAVLLTMMQLNGEHRLRPSTGAIAGWQFTKQYLIVMSPNHERGGVCRSDLYWHGLRNYVSGEGGIDKIVKAGNKNPSIKPMTEFDDKDWNTFHILREQYCKHVRTLFQTMKRMLLGKSSGDSVSHSVNSEFKCKSQQTLFSEK